MKRPALLTCMCLVVILLMSMITMAKSVEAAGVDGEIVFEDSFDGQKDEWNLHNGAMIVGGRMFLPSKAIAYTDILMEGMGMRFDLKGSGVLNVNFHNSEPGAHSALHVPNYGYIMWIDGPKTQVNIIKPTEDGSTIRWLAGGNFKFPGDVSITDSFVTFEVIKTKAKNTDKENSAHWVIKMNGKVMFDADSQAIDNPANSGYFGFYVFEGRWEIDNLTIWRVAE